MQKVVVTAISKVTHSWMQLWSKQLKYYTGTSTNTKPKLQKPIVRSHLTLNIAIELIKPKLLLIAKITLKLSLQTCSPSVANAMLGICYTCVALCCSAHWCCAMECGVACCAAQHTAIATLTLLV